MYSMKVIAQLTCCHNLTSSSPSFGLVFISMNFTNSQHIFTVQQSCAPQSNWLAHSFHLSCFGHTQKWVNMWCINLYMRINKSKATAQRCEWTRCEVARVLHTPTFTFIGDTETYIIVDVSESPLVRILPLFIDCKLSPCHLCQIEMSFRINSNASATNWIHSSMTATGFNCPHFQTDFYRIEIPFWYFVSPQFHIILCWTTRTQNIFFPRLFAASVWRWSWYPISSEFSSTIRLHFPFMVDSMTYRYCPRLFIGIAMAKSNEDINAVFLWIR